MTIPSSRPWSAVVCGVPDAATLVIVDWLILAAQHAGFTARALPLGGGSAEPFGVYVEVASTADSELGGSSVPWGSVDLIIAGEHMELARALAAGYADPQVTTIVTSCHRRFAPVERGAMPASVVREREIDAAAIASARCYVSFDTTEVCEWYGLSTRAEPGLLLGGALGADALGLDLDSCAQAVVALGIDAKESLRGLERGQRFGRRSGGRVTRTFTAAQFVRKRRSALHRSERAAFEALVERVHKDFPDHAHAPLREGVFQLAQFHNVAYAARYIDLCLDVQREEQARSVSVAGSVVDEVARNLAAMLAYPDLPWVAARKLRGGRLQEIRRWHGIPRGVPYTVTDLVPVEEEELRDLRSRSAARSAPPGLGAHHVLRIDPATVAGAIRLRMLRRLAGRREQSARHRAEVDTAEAYVAAVRDTIRAAPELTDLVARSGALVQGYGAVRAGAREAAAAFWGRIVRQALSIDRLAPDGQPHVARLLVPFVYDGLSTRGILALWDTTGQTVGIALELARDHDYGKALAYARALCGIEPLPAPSEAAPPAAAQGTHEDAVIATA